MAESVEQLVRRSHVAPPWDEALMERARQVIRRFCLLWASWVDLAHKLPFLGRRGKGGEDIGRWICIKTRSERGFGNTARRGVR